ncbi:hypothetical protein CPC08DRAFT_725976 [Agrocybe pediades]|nr:hypothetical protein CPC08DRAFT_725976 [Agrocybe pediades]
MALTIQPSDRQDYGYTISGLIPVSPISVLHEDLLWTIFLNASTSTRVIVMAASIVIHCPYMLASLSAMALHPFVILFDMGKAHRRCLFEDYAPRLRYFGVYRMAYNFSVNTSWLQNLAFVAFPEAFTVKEILTALRGMPRLVSMILSGIGSGTGPQYQDGGKVVLPYLKLLETPGDSVIEVGALLECITTSPDRCLSMQPEILMIKKPADVDELNNHKYEYYRYEEALKSHTLPYLSKHCPLSVRFCLGDVVLVLEDADPESDLSRDGFRIALATSFLSISSFMKEVIVSSWLSQISRFELALRAFPRSSYPLESLRNNDPVLIDVMRAVSSSATTLLERKQLNPTARIAIVYHSHPVFCPYYPGRSCYSLYRVHIQ